MASNEKEFFTTPTGRLVGGSIFVPNTTDFQGNPLLDKNKNPRVEYYVAVAILKTDPKVEELRGKIHQVAARDFPGVIDPNTMVPINPQQKFAFKYIDGDSQVPDSKGRRPCDNENYRGCWVFKFTTGFAPKAFNGACQVLTDPNSIKLGYYVSINGSTSGNKSVGDQAGVYLNWTDVQHVGGYDEISIGSDGAAAFAQNAAALPPGVANTPPVATPMAASPAPGAPPVAPMGVPTAVPPAVATPAPAPAYLPPAGAVAPGAPPATPAPVAAQVPPVAAPAVAAPVTPAPNFLAPPVAAPAPAAPVVAPAPPVPAGGPVMAASAGGATYEAMIAAGWTHDAMVAAGHIAHQAM